jgi:hypothetical protein
VEAKAGRLVYACCTNIRVKTESDPHKEAYSAELTTLFSTTRQMSVIALSAAIGRGLPYRMVLEVSVMLGVGRREKSSRLFFLEIRTHRGAATPPEGARSLFGGSRWSQQGGPAAYAAPPT